MTLPMEDPANHDATTDDPAASSLAQEAGGLKGVVLGYAMRVPVMREAYGIHLVYRDVGGGLIVGGLSYAALFALLPSLVLAIAMLSWLIDDPVVRADAILLLGDAFPAFKDVAGPALDGAGELAAAGSVVAIATFAWAASGLYVSLTRAMERFFPGQRVGTVLARIGGVAVVVLIVVAILAAVLLGGVVTVIAGALGLDENRALAVVGGLGALAGAACLTYAAYRIIPAAPPSRRAAIYPAVLVGIVIGLMTILYGVISPWLVSGYQMYGVLASVFVALVWLRVVFMAMVYGAAMARHMDDRGDEPGLGIPRDAGSG